MHVVCCSAFFPARLYSAYRFGAVTTLEYSMNPDTGNNQGGSSFCDCTQRWPAHMPLMLHNLLCLSLLSAQLVGEHLEACARCSGFGVCRLLAAYDARIYLLNSVCSCILALFAAGCTCGGVLVPHGVRSSYKRVVLCA